MIAAVYAFAVLGAGDFALSDLTLPRERRPAWVRDRGIIMAGSWEPLLFRVRRDGSSGYEPSAGERAGYEREHSLEMLRELRGLGVNFIMMHCYKGFGMEAERASMEDATRFAALARSEGMRVGCYAFSGTMGWELMLRERPDAAEWAQLDARGEPVPYGSMKFRHYIDRMHPGAVEYLNRIVRFAVEEMRVDLLHFDNYAVGPGYGSKARTMFADFVGGRSLDPAARDREFQRFGCWWLARSYADLSAYARSLRPDVLVECNPGGIGDRLRPPVDHWLLLPGGEAFWDEGESPGWDGTSLRSRIRTYKVGRRLGNMAFAYATTPLEAAESIAFNLDCLGCIVWFEYGKLLEKPGSAKPVSPSLAPYVKLFNRVQPAWGGSEVIADVAVLRSFASQVFAPAENARTTWRVEQALIERRVPFQIVADRDLAAGGRVDGFRVLLLAGCAALSERDGAASLDFARSGGRGLVVVGPAGRFDEQLKPCERPALERWAEKKFGSDSWRVERDGARLSYLPALPERRDELIDAVRWASGGELSAEVAAPACVACEYVRRGGGGMAVHLVNYSPEPVAGIVVRMPAAGRGGKRWSRAAWWTAASEAPTAVAFQIEGSRARIELPPLDVYGLLVLEE